MRSGKVTSEVNDTRDREREFKNIIEAKNLSINNFSISLPESDEGSSQMRESQMS